MEQTKHDVFISYSRKDYMDEQKNVIPGNEVSKIKDALDNAGITYWFDEEGIYSGQNFVEKIVTNIENSRIFLFLSTANSNQSPWTCKEIASADELNKHIIPVRLDPTPYNKTVLFHISALDYIKYYTNPEKGMADLIESIKTYLTELAAEEKQKEEERKKREEEQRRQKELKEKRIQEEQKKLVAEITLTCKTLNNEEAKLELDRDTLFQKARGVLDDSRRDSLIDMIKTGGTIHQKYQKQLSKLTNEIKELKTINSGSSEEETEDRDEQISQLQTELRASKSREEQQEKKNDLLGVQVEDLQKKLKDLEDKGNAGGKGKTSKRVHELYGLVISLLLIGGGLWLATVYEKKDRWESRYDSTWNELRQSKEAIRLVADNVPFVVTDIEVKNDGEEWGDIIYSSKSTYFIPRIKYIGLKEGTYELGVKIYGKYGLSQGNKSPSGYSYLEDVYIRDGENYSSAIGGWGKKDPGNWPAGTYRIEIWYKGRKLSEKTYSVNASQTDDIDAAAAADSALAL